MNLLDGKALSKKIKEEIAGEVKQLVANGKGEPFLAAILVGDNPASEAYMRNKVRSCEQVGFKSKLIRRDKSVTEEELLEIVHELNDDEDVDGFIVQLPLPRHIDPDKVLLAIDPRKDVDGFHPYNFGSMAQGLDCFVPATPLGIILMIDRYGVETSGKHVVVVGRSNIVGTPISILLSRKKENGNATVTLTHSRTKDLESYLLQADIIVSALGRPRFITGEMVKEGVVIIDVGINRIEDATKKSGYRLVGDVDFDSVSKKASFITPVPGGVGPMTVTSLLLNTLKARKQR